jgi:hypothetical protein
MNDSTAIVKIDHEFLLENFLSDFYKKSKEFIPGQACNCEYIDNEEILHYKFKNGDTLNEKLGIIEYEGRQVFDCIFKEAITEPYEYDLRIELLKHLKLNPVKFKISKKSPTLLTKPKNEDIINP